MKPNEINRRLALAIGYADEGVHIKKSGEALVWRPTRDLSVNGWQEFDYRDAATIYPIAEKYFMFPERGFVSGEWSISRKGFNLSDACPRACIALATIEAHDRGLI